MSAPTQLEREHYARLAGCTVTGVVWAEMEGQPLPVLLARTPQGGRLQVAVLCDPEGNGLGWLDITAEGEG